VSLKTTHHAIRFARDQAHKGRGAGLNVEGRFEQRQREAFDDGWGAGEFDNNGSLSRPPTVVTEELAKSIIARNDSPDIPFYYSLNPYRGCEHGCIYCFARPTHAYLGLSPGLDFETRLFAKVNAPELLRNELSQDSYRCEVIALGVVTDAFQPCERRHLLTRRCLEVMRDFNQPVALITKSALIERDLDILVPMAEKGLVHVTLSVTTLDHDVSRLMEPRTAAPQRRLQTIRRLSEAGIPVGIHIAPVIPFLTDHELEDLIAAGRDMGAETAGYILLRLPWELKELFRQWLETHFPLKAAHVMSHLQAMRNGRDNDPAFGSRMVGNGIYADLLAQRFAKACRRFGMKKRGRGVMQKLDAGAFSVPGRPVQAKLF
jgi:DNA repair photolyase